MKVNKKELKEIIKQSKPYADLNYLDVSGIIDMSYLFECSKFQGNINSWDVKLFTIQQRYI